MNDCCASCLRPSNAQLHKLAMELRQQACEQLADYLAHMAPVITILPFPLPRASGALMWTCTPYRPMFIPAIPTNTSPAPSS